MKMHSIVDCITNSSSTVFMFPHDNSVDKIKKMLGLLIQTIEQKYDINIDLSSELEINIKPHDSWIHDRENDRKNEIKEYNKNRKKCSNMTDEEFINFYGKLETDEEFQAYLNNIENAYIGENKIPYIQLSVKLCGEDISDYFKLYDVEIVMN